MSSSLVGFDFFKQKKAREQNQYYPVQPIERKAASGIVSTPHDVSIPVVPAPTPPRAEDGYKKRRQQYQQRKERNQQLRYYQQRVISSYPAWVLVLLGVAAFIIAIYVLIIAHGNLDWDVAQDLRGARYAENIVDLTEKDMLLMDMDTLLRNNLTSLMMRLEAEIEQRLAKDMILMGNVSDIDDAVTQNRAEQNEKDMILMGNVSSLIALLQERGAFDVELLEQFMIKFGNLTLLQTRIDQEGVDRLDADMGFMTNATNLQDQLDQIENDLNSIISTVDVSLFDEQIQQIGDKHMVLMDNVTDFDAEITTKFDALDAKDVELANRLDALDARTAAKLDRANELLDNVTALGGMAIMTINNNTAIAGEMSVVGSTNDYSNQIDVTTTSNTVAFSFVPSTIQRGPTWSATYIMDPWKWADNAGTIPASCDPCRAIACLRCYSNRGIATGFVFSTYTTQHFYNANSRGAWSGSVSEFNPSYPAACTSSSCVTARIFQCDDNGLNCREGWFTGQGSSGAVRLPAGGSYAVEATLFADHHPYNGDQYAFLALEYRVTTTGPGSSQDIMRTINMMAQYPTPSCAYRNNLIDSMDTCTNGWRPCGIDNYNSDDQPRSQNGFRFSINCNHIIHVEPGASPKYVMYRMVGSNNYEEAGAAGNNGLRFSEGVNNVKLQVSAAKLH